MKIEHIAIWVDDLESMRDFYTRYFGMQSGTLYHNPAKSFTSCFLSFETDSSTRIELMHTPETFTPEMRGRMKGLAHLAISTGSRDAVVSLTERLRRDGHPVVGEPRTTGDGYFESVVSDPEGNIVEITE